jgi:hypothetical protein
MNIKKYARVLSAMTLLCGMGVAANAELRDDVVVTVPFDFVVGHKMLPAGKYKVSSLSLSQSSPLRLTSGDNGVSVFVLPFEGERAGVDMPQLTFQQVGEQHFLSIIQTGQNLYNIPVSRSLSMEAAARLHDKMPVSGDSGGTLMR